MPLSNRQKAMVHVAKSQLGMKVANYRALHQRIADVTSSTQRNTTGFERVMAVFERLGFQATHPRLSASTGGRRADMAAPGPSVGGQRARRYLACAEARMCELEQTQRIGELPDRDEKSKCIDILNGVQAHKAAGGCRQTDS